MWPYTLLAMLKNGYYFEIMDKNIKGRLNEPAFYIEN